jgi:hypothetical protein
MEGGMSDETTPAIERAYRAMRPDFRKDDLDPGILGGLLTVRTGLAAALDVEEIARAMCLRHGCDGSKRSCPDHSVNVERAIALRATVLGGAA